MSNHSPDDRLEGQVRAHLDRQAEAVDAVRLWQQIQDRLAYSDPDVVPYPAPAVTGTSKLRRKIRWSVAAAAGILLLILSSLTFTGQAGAETLLQQTTRAHEQPVDRFYALEIKPDPALLARLPQAPTVRCQVWTREDRFWVAMKGFDQPWHWGRDGQGRIWLTVQPQVGLRFAAGEVPDPLQEFIALRSADVPAILRDVLQQCELSDVVSTPRQRIIQAQHRPSRHPFPVLFARLEINPTRHELQSLVLLRGDSQGQPLGQVTLQLLGSSHQADAHYELESHLRAPWQIVDQRQALRRMRLLMAHLHRVLHLPPAGNEPPPAP